MTILVLFLYTCISSSVLVIYVLINQLFTRNINRLPPGPTPWPIVGNLPHINGPIPHHSLATLAKKYGPLMHLRLGCVNVVVAESASVAEQFLKAHDTNFASRPPNSGTKHIAYNNRDLVFAPYGPRWRMLRKICSLHLFSAKALDDFRHVREEEVAILTRVLLVHASPVKLGQLLNVCTTNTLARVTLGRRVFADGIEGVDPKADEFKDMVDELMVLAGEFYIGDYIPALDRLDFQGITKKMKILHARFDKFLSMILDEHKIENDASRVDLLTTLISLMNGDDDGEEGKLSDIEIKALLLNLFTAGTDPPASTVEWAMAELIRQPKILKEAREELDKVVGQDRLVTELDLNRLTFLQAIVKETLRLHPTTPLSLPRLALESCEVNGYHIPKGSTLLVNVWAIARDPKMWANPLEFRPSRFLPGGEKPEADVKGNDFEIIPFGSGRRMCAGMRLGMRMVQLLIATLIQTFDWELASGLEPEKLNMEESFGLTLQRAEPLMVHPRPRLAPQVYESG
uniref:flavonoid 3'-monooxygenase-like n=1 Tax=Erigeron canadensis TaxID=72917 RepID=UPI001CB9C37D|nr:flavonoid 3'-monooxygenase-like [Erigeron canadensis]